MQVLAVAWACLVCVSCGKRFTISNVEGEESLQGELQEADEATVQSRRFPVLKALVATAAAFQAPAHSWNTATRLQRVQRAPMGGVHAAARFQKAGHSWNDTSNIQSTNRAPRVGIRMLNMALEEDSPVLGQVEAASSKPLSKPQPLGFSLQDGLSSSTERRINKSSGAISERGISGYRSRGAKLIKAAMQTLRQQNFVATLCFAMAAAMVFNPGAATGAAILPDALDAASLSSVEWKRILSNAGKKALGGGSAGATAAITQVISLMWLHTAMNYQYRYGGDLKAALKALYKQGGIPRFYRGLPVALVLAPLARFGDTAANAGMLALLDGIPKAAGLPLAIRTAAATFTASLWRIFCMPLDTWKTVLQVDGQDGFEKLKQTVLKQGPGPLFQGSFATIAETVAVGYPWFLTYNFLNGRLPQVATEKLLLSLTRAAFLGLSASCVSGAVANPLKVIKTTQQTGLLKSNDTLVGLRKKSVNVAGAEAGAEGGQTSKDTTGMPIAEEAFDAKGSEAGTDRRQSSEDAKGISIAEAVALVVEKDGIKGLLGRGLKTRLLLSAIQGSLFSVLWQYFQAAR